MTAEFERTQSSQESLQKPRLKPSGLPKKDFDTVIKLYEEVQRMVREQFNQTNLQHGDNSSTI